MRKKALLIKAVVSAAFFVILFSNVRRGDFFNRLANVDWRYFALSFAAAGAMIGSSCLKWRLLLRQQGHDVPYLSLLRIYFIGYFFTSLLPSNVGGDVVRSYFIGRRIGSQSHAAVSVFIERFSGIIFLLIMAVVGPLLRPELYRSPLIWIPGFGAAGLLVMVIWLWKMENPFRLPDGLVRVVGVALRGGGGGGMGGRAAAWLEKGYGRVRRGLESFHSKLVAAVRYLGANRGPLAWLVGLTVLFYFLTWVNVYVSFRAFRVEVAFRDVVVLLPTAMLVAMIPVTFMGNLGFTEGVYVGFFRLVGVSPAASLAMGLLLRFKLLVVGSTGLVSYLTYRHESPVRLAEEMKREGESTGGERP